VNTRLVVWMARYPALHRAILIAAYVHILLVFALAVAPSVGATPPPGAAMVAWTGLHDDDGVPLAKYFLSVVPITDAIVNNGQHIDVTDPSTVVKWLGSAVNAGMSHDLVAFVLTWEAAAMVFLLGISLSMLRFALAGKWLVALTKIGRPIFDVIHWLAWKIELAPTAAAMCVCVAYYHHVRGRTARAWSMVWTATIFMILIWTFFKDPVNDLVSDRGLLGMMMRTGFGIAADVRAALHTGIHTAGDTIQSQVDAMSSHLVTVTARPMIQLMNYGTADLSPKCQEAWSLAMKANDGTGPSPTYAMNLCGAHDAYMHAEQLGANDILLGNMFVFTSFLISVFIWFVAISTFLVGTKALFYAVVVVPALFCGMIWERAKIYGINTAGQLALHGIQMLIFTVCMAVGVEVLEWILTTSMFGESRMMVVPRLLFAGFASIIGIVMFHWIDRHWYTHSWGTITHTVSGAWMHGRDYAQEEWRDVADRYHAGIERGRQVRDAAQRGLSGWRGGEPAVGPDGEATDGGAGTVPAPEFEVVKPRPTAVRAAKAKKKAAKVKKVAKVVGEGAAGVEVAEVAGAVLAPEVAVPVAVAATVVNHVRHRHDSDRPRRARAVEANGDNAANHGQPNPDPIPQQPAQAPELPEIAQRDRSTPARGKPPAHKHPDDGGLKIAGNGAANGAVCPFCLRRSCWEGRDVCADARRRDGYLGLEEDSHQRRVTEIEPSLRPGTDQ
jgi:hypothetical protein